MKRKIEWHSFIFIGIIISALFFHCDKGLSPDDVKSQSGISGTVYFQNWPSPDSLLDIRLIAFRNFPPGNIRDEVLSKRAIVYPDFFTDTTTLPFYVDSLNYTMLLDPGIYEYLVFAQRYGEDLYNDWLAVGQYDTTLQDPLPTPLEVPYNQILDSIFIYVNFDSLPIQPF
jgi:hypothetical protein